MQLEEFDEFNEEVPPLDDDLFSFLTPIDLASIGVTAPSSSHTDEDDGSNDDKYEGEDE
jgi:hypothetical protein